MTEHKHTPGPWQAKASLTHWNVTTTGKPRTFNICSVNTDRIEQEANARLIAAAPDLLNSCGDLVALFEALAIVGTMDGADWNRIHNYCEKARRALAAARVA